MKRAAIPKNKRSADEIVERMESALKKDVDWRGGRVFSLVYHAGEEHEALKAWRPRLLAGVSRW